MPNVYPQVHFNKEKLQPQELPTYGGKIIHVEEATSSFLHIRNPSIVLYLEVDKSIFDKGENPNRKFIAVNGDGGSLGLDNYEHAASIRLESGHLLHILQEVDA